MVHGEPIQGGVTMQRLLSYTAALLLVVAAPIPRHSYPVFQQAIITSAANAPAAQGGAEKRKPEHPAWSYSGPDGPQNWVKNYPDCGRKDQSPVDITNSQPAPLPAIEFHYQSSPLFITNNGHTIQIDYPVNETPANTITIGGEEYTLRQFHFHQPSEEKIQGHGTDMVVHLVHQRGEGVYMRLAVVAVLLRGGSANPLIDTLWQHIPNDVTHEPVKVPDVNINAADLLPANRGYFTYLGSLTTPPCTEIVTWYILKATTPLSPQQIETFKKHYSNNVRPVQPLDGRTVEQTQ
jgi:carbonic anhydrase